MPGILPMKVIKVGTSAQARIAQACDRCRSKKIRCDGIRPCCTQCDSVGFECKTSDKLSRRAFPRGYTESLEERVRSLELEVRELKDLLDAKDEKMDMLARMHSHSPQYTTSRRSSSIQSPAIADTTRETLQQRDHDDPSDTFKVQQSPYLLGGESSDAYFSGTSSARILAESFRRKLQEHGKSASDFNADLLLKPNNQRKYISSQTAGPLWQPPPRLLSDQMVNVFFQEWAPLFPVLHRPTFLALYESYVSSSGAIADKPALAILNLVFAIACLSGEDRISYDAGQCERQWVAALSTFSTETSMTSLQCLVLAQVYCIQKGDPAKALHYKSLAVGMCQRLGLNQSQKRFALGALTSETRKKVFWTLYTLDCFSAAMLGLPQLLREDDIDCEYPVDADDEYVTEKGFQPTLPGESTKLSSALALFRGSRILSKVLTRNYPASASHKLSLKEISDLDEDLQEWSDGLPPHLRLEFVNDKPSTHVISSRCPLLSLTYHFIRSLIHRPAVCASLGDRASSSLMVLAESSKHIIQIIQLLEERNLSFSICLHKGELIMQCALGRLFQAVEIPSDSKLWKECQRDTGTAINLLKVQRMPGTIDFRRIACAVFASNGSAMSVKQSPSQRSTSDMPSFSAASPDARKRLQDVFLRYAAAASSRKYASKDERSPSIATPSVAHSSSTSQVTNGRFRSIAPSSTQDSPISTSSQMASKQESDSPDRQSGKRPCISSVLNLDYFSFANDDDDDTCRASVSQPAAQEHGKWQRAFSAKSNVLETSPNEIDQFDWLLNDDILSTDMLHSAPEEKLDWSENEWPKAENARALGSHLSMAKSVPSLTDESLTSGGEFGSIEFGSIESESAFGALAMPFSQVDEHVLSS